MSQPRFFTGVDGHLQIAGLSLKFSAYTWVGGNSMLPMWTAASAPFADELPCLQQPMSLLLMGLFSEDLDPVGVFSTGDEVEDVIVFINDTIQAACDFAQINNLQVGVTAEGVSFFRVSLTSTWKYENFSS